MSGHSKWSSIKHKKAATDSKRGKIFSRLSKEIMVATKDGGKDIDANPRLRAAVAAARSANVPNDNIDRAIKKGAGELEGQLLEELSYEAYAPGGVAVMVDCLTDNRNRTAAEIRNIINKGNGNLAGSGAVGWMFHRKARFVVTGDAADEDNLMTMCFDAGVDIEDINVEDDVAELVGPPEAFGDILHVLEAAGITPSESGLDRVPENETPIAEVGIARQVLRLLDALEDNEDVQRVFSNAEIPDEILEALAAE